MRKVQSLIFVLYKDHERLAFMIFL